MNGWSRCATEAATWMQGENRATDLDRLVQIELVDIPRVRAAFSAWVDDGLLVGPSRDEETRGVGTWEEP